MKRKPTKPKRQRKQYWSKIEQQKAYAANIAFLDALIMQKGSFRLKLAWYVLRRINPVTGEKYKEPK